MSLQDDHRPRPVARTVPPKDRGVWDRTASENQFMRIRPRSGFTLIELLVVIAIINGEVLANTTVRDTQVSSFLWPSNPSTTAFPYGSELCGQLRPAVPPGRRPRRRRRWRCSRPGFLRGILEFADGTSSTVAFTEVRTGDGQTGSRNHTGVLHRRPVALGPAAPDMAPSRWRPTRRVMPTSCNMSRRATRCVPRGRMSQRGGPLLVRGPLPPGNGHLDVARPPTRRTPTASRTQCMNDVETFIL